MVRATALAIWLTGSLAVLAQALPVTVPAAPAAPASPPAAAAPAQAAQPSAPAAPAGPDAAPGSQPAPLLSPPETSQKTGDALSLQQQDSMRAAILGQSTSAVSNTDLDATVGAAVPDGVALHDLPAGSAAPGLAGLKYVVLTDGRIVFVDPATRTIRAVLG